MWENPHPQLGRSNLVDDLWYKTVLSVRSDNRSMQRAFQTQLKLNNRQRTLMATHAGYSRWV
ncbi:MAG: helix-turn-helix domain-containing protein, partial [Limnoraphis robusta]